MQLPPEACRHKTGFSSSHCTPYRVRSVLCKWWWSPRPLQQTFSFGFCYNPVTDMSHSQYIQVTRGCSNNGYDGKMWAGQGGWTGEQNWTLTQETTLHSNQQLCMFTFYSGHWTWSTCLYSWGCRTSPVCYNILQEMLDKLQIAHFIFYKAWMLCIFHSIMRKLINHTLIGILLS